MSKTIRFRGDSFPDREYRIGRKRKASDRRHCVGSNLERRRRVHRFGVKEKKGVLDIEELHSG